MCFLTKILFRACATSTVLLLPALPCVTTPSEELNEAPVSRRLRDVTVSIPIAGVRAGKGSVAYLTTYFDASCSRALGPGIFFTVSCQ